MTGWEMVALRLFFLAGVITCLGGCGVFTRGLSQDVAVVTIPAGAALTFSNGTTCASPCSVTIDRLATLTVRAEKPGCEPTIRDVSSAFPEGGTSWLSAFDFEVGSAAEHQPNPATITLVCSGGKPIAMTPFDDRTMTLLHDDQELSVVLEPFDAGAYQRAHPRMFPRN